MSRAPHCRLAIGLPFVLGLLLVAAVGSVGAESAPTLDDFLCARSKPAPRVDRTLRFTPQKSLTVRNRAFLQALKTDLRKPLGLCMPASIAGAPVANPATFLAAYGAQLARTRPPQPRPAFDLQHVTNRFGDFDLRLKGLDDVMVRSAAVLDPPPLPVSVPTAADDYACWDVERGAGTAAAAPLTIASAIGTWQLDVKAPTRLCFASTLGGAAPDPTTHPKALACYTAKLTRTKPKQGKPLPRLAAIANRFGTEQLSLTATLDLCVPSDATGVNATPTPQRTLSPTPTPTVTPPPDFTLAVAPSALTVDIGTSAHFTATAHYTNGDVVDFTERVVWRSSNDSALPLNQAGDRGRVDTVNGGSAVISVYDELTGVASTDTGDDAILTVDWTLERIELLPETITRGLGESVRFRANGHFAGGFTRSIADRLIWASSAPSVAAPTNAEDPLDHSKVLAAGTGSAVISASDPMTGFTSTASGDDVTMTVVGPLDHCNVQLTDISLGVGAYYQFTAVGHYPSGFSHNITQQVQWTTDDPAIASAPNTEGDRSRVIALAPGDTHVNATDTVTGVVCDDHPVVRVATAQSLHLQPPHTLDWFPKRAGRSWHAVAVERFAPPKEKEYVTEDVVFSSSNPSVVTAPNVAGDHGRLDAVGSGTAIVKAVDPRNGLESQEITLRSLDGLKRVRFDLGNQKTILDLSHFNGATLYLNAVGEFADGNATLEPTDVTYVSDNPAVVKVQFYPGPVRFWELQALAPGVATITVTDMMTGISSDAFGDSLRVGVRGPVDKITLVPPTVTRRVGESHAFAAVVHYVGGVVENGTPRVEYHSSYPNVAVALNDYWVRSRVDAVGPGTTTISAVDPATGVSSDDSGGSAVMTVVGPLTRVRVQPTSVTRSSGRGFSFTAIGNDAAGRSINVTQDVVWSSSDPQVATALNVEGNRSRVVAHGEGMATIAAYDVADGVSSTTTGDDATFVCHGYLTSLALSSDELIVTVGDSIPLTATGRLNTGDAVNLTQEVEYISTDPSVAKPLNTPGDRSRILALKPGSVIISAYDAATNISTNGHDRVTLVITAP